jgi:hypothetical protein
MMKWVFVLSLLVVGAFGGWLALNVVHWWQTDMFHTQRVMPGEAAYSMPTGSLPRNGGQMYYSPADRDAAAARRNPIAATTQSRSSAGLAPSSKKRPALRLLASGSTTFLPFLKVCPRLSQVIV